MVRRKYAKLYCWLRLSYANPSSTLSLLALDRTSVSVITIVVKEIEIKINMQAAWAMSEPQSFSRWHQLSCRSHSGQASKRRAVPLGADIYDTLVAGVSPENRFMNLLNSDRFSLVKRWEGDINPPSFIVPDATGSTLIVGRDLRLKKKCSIRVELTNAAPTILDVKSNNLLLVFSSSNQNAGGALGVEVVNTSDTRIRFQDA